MSNVEKEYQKRFSDKQESNTDFDAESLWGAIQTEVQPKKKDRKHILWFSLSILILGAGTLIWLHHNPSNASIQNATTLPENNIVHTKIENSKESKDIDKYNSATASIATTIERTSLAVIQSDTQALPSEIKNKIITHNLKKTVPNKNIRHINTTGHPLSTDVDQYHENFDALATKQNKPESVQKIEEQLVFVSSTPSKKIEKINIDPISTLKNRSLDNRRTEIDHNPTAIAIQSNTDNNEECDEDNSQNIRIDLYSGINYNNHNYASSNVKVDALKNESESTFSGNTFGLAISKPIYNNILGTIGIEYNNLWTKTEVNLSIDSSKALIDEIVKVIIDPQTQDTIDVFRDSVTVYALYTRELIHHNNVKTISFPLSFGFHHKMRQLDLGINLGIVYSLRIQQTGKGYNNQGEIFEFNEESSTLPFKKSSVAFRLRPIIRYKFNESYSLSFSPQYQFSKGSHISDNSVSVTSSVWNFNIGIGMRF